MADEVMVRFTAKSVETCLAERGTQSLVLNRTHAKRCKYAILCRNAHTDWGDGKEPHRTAFMIGRISDVVPSTEPNHQPPEKRWLVKFDEYARLDIPDFWRGWRNPVRYTTVEELPFSLSDVDFKPMPELTEQPEKAVSPPAKAPSRVTIADAKIALAATFGVEPEAVEIIIHG